MKKCYTRETWFQGTILGKIIRIELSLDIIKREGRVKKRWEVGTKLIYPKKKLPGALRIVKRFLFLPTLIRPGYINTPGVFLPPPTNFPKSIQWLKTTTQCQVLSTEGKWVTIFYISSQTDLKKAHKVVERDLEAERGQVTTMVERWAAERLEKKEKVSEDVGTQEKVEE